MVRPIHSLEIRKPKVTSLFPRGSWQQETGSGSRFKAGVQSQNEDSLQIYCLLITLSEKAVVPHSSVLAWRIPGTGEPGGLLSMGSHRVGHD